MSTTSTSATKKKLVDFLWEWAESRGDWGKLLVSQITKTETSLSKTEREEIFSYFLQKIGLKSSMPPLTLSKPNFTNSNSSTIILQNISQVKGVNKLAADQKIEFCKNITVIYGLNGSGKSGYSRILNILGYGYEPIKKILGNAYDSRSTPQTASIEYLVNSDSKVFIWTGNNSNEELSQLSFFNSSCVNFTLNPERKLIVSPMGFHLFSLVSKEVDELKKIFDSLMLKYRTDVQDILSNLHEDTSSYNYIENLSAHSKIDDVEVFCKLEDDIYDNIKAYEDELSNLNLPLIEKEISSHSDRLNDILRLLKLIKNDKRKITKEEWLNNIANIKKLKELESTTTTGIIEIAKAKGILFYESKEFKNFIQSAENYIKLFHKEYPKENDSCIYCLQSLKDKESFDLLQNYRKILNDTSQAEISKLKLSIDVFYESVSSINSTLAFNHDVFGKEINNNKEDVIIQPDFLNLYNTNINKLKEILQSNEFDGYEYNLDFDTAIEDLTKKEDEIKIIKDEKIKSKNNIKISEKELKNKIYELKDKIFLNSISETIKSKIKNIKIVNVLNYNRKDFDTTLLSRKNSEASGELIRDEFDMKFTNELNNLNKKKLQIKLNLGTVTGNTVIRQNINDYNLKDILSEGEQKAIALAEFFVELDIDNSNSPVIFDDPVNSLDQDMIEAVAKRLIELSEKRQVIVFTHNILFYYGIVGLSEKFKTVEFKYWDSKRNDENEYCGYISESIAPDKERFNRYVSKINSMIGINQQELELKKDEIIPDCYALLRSAIEVLIEDKIFAGTIKRYKKNVMLTKFSNVKGEVIDKNKESIIELFEKSSAHIKGHSSPDEIPMINNVQEFKEDLLKFETIAKEFA